jgi:predicted aspartyl protease
MSSRTEVPFEAGTSGSGEMRIGNHVVRNVAARVGPAVSSDALLGQSFLSKLPSWTLDNKRHVLIVAR